MQFVPFESLKEKVQFPFKELNYQNCVKQRGEVVTSSFHGSKFLDKKQTRKHKVTDSHCFKLHRPYQFHFICQMLGKYSGVESERTISKFRKRNFVVFSPTSTKRAREIKNIHVAVVQRRLRKGVMHMQSCCSANLNLFLFLPFLLSLPSSFLKLLIELFSLYVFFS